MSADPVRYMCRGCRRDIGDLVTEELTGEEPVYLGVGRSSQAHKWLVIVRCPCGVDNEFRGTNGDNGG